MADYNDADIKGFDDKPIKAAKGRRKRGKGLIIAGAVVLVVAGATAVIVPRLLDQDKYKTLIKEKVADATGYSVDWSGDIGISILPLPSIHMKDLTLNNGQASIVKLKEADVRVALMPLFEKRIEITSVDLVEPDITLIIDKQGRQQWMTDKLSKSESQPNEVTGQNDGTENQSSSADIVLNSLKISKGRLLFKNEQAGTQQLIENVNASLRAESLTGPYAARGDLSYDGKTMEFDLKAGKLDGNAQSYPVSAKISLPAVKLDGEYSGVISTSSPMTVDGELTVSAKDLAQTIEAFTNKVPELPDGIGGESQLKAKLFYDGAQVKLDQMRLAVGEIAYSGNIAVTKLDSDAPPLSINLSPEQGTRSEAPSPLVAMLQDLSVKGTGTYAAGKAKIDNGNVNFRGQQIAFSGTYVPAAGQERAKLDAVIKVNKIDLDALTGAISPINGKTDKTATQKVSDTPAIKGAGPLTGMVLPFDGHVQADIGSLSSGGKTYAPLKADIVSRGNTLVINSLNVGIASNATIAAKGRINNLAVLSGLDISASMQTNDAESLMKSFGIAPPIDQKIGAASVNGSAKGNLDSLVFSGVANALKFSISGQGNVASPLQAPVVSNLAINVKHPQLVDAIRTFQPEFSALPPSFRGPLDISAVVAMNDKTYTLNNIKGSLGNTAVSGNLNAVIDEKPSVKGELSFGDIVFDATKVTAQGGGGKSGSSAPAAPSQSSGRWSNAPIDVSWMQSFDADLAIKARSITQDLWKLSNANLSFALQNGVMNIRDVSASMFGGQAVLNGQVTSQPLSLAMGMKASNVDARQLLSALTGKASETLNGSISDFSLDMKGAGSSQNTLVNSLNGKGAMAGRNIIVKGIDVAQLAETAKGSFKPLERAGSLLQSFQNGQTQFDTFDADFNIQNGVATFTELKFDGPRALISGTGTVSLPRWTVDLKNTVTVKGTDIPPFDITLRGPLDNPAQAGGNVIEDYLRSKAQKKVEKLIGKELEKRFGIPLGGNEPAATETAPAAGDGAAAEPAPAPAQQLSPKKAAEKEALKALQGLLGGQ